MNLTSSDSDAVHQYVHKFGGQPHIRLVIFGKLGVGKRSFQRRLSWGEFLGDHYDAMENDLFRAKTQINGKYIFCDGEMLAPRYSAVDYPEGSISHYRSIRHVEACVFMYDVGSRSSFEDIKRYHENFVLERSSEGRLSCILRCSPVCGPRPTPYPGSLFVIANKIDRPIEEWQVMAKEGEEFATSIGASFSALSVKTAEGWGPDRLEHMSKSILLRRAQMTATESEEEGVDVNLRVPRSTEQKNGRFWY